MTNYDLYNDLRDVFMDLGEEHFEDGLNIGKALYEMSDRIKSVEDWNVLVCAINAEMAIREKNIRRGPDSFSRWQDHRERYKERRGITSNAAELYDSDDIND